ncbi:MAG: c-type cytochrome [Epsilonproteobacteria bacterium]|nr:c-type cytochrome [Campylobacterota bacterium]
MIKHILAGLALIVTLGTFWHLLTVDKEIDALGKVEEIFRKSDLLVEMGKKSAGSATLSEAGTSAPLTPVDTPSIESEEKKKEEDKLKALREKAGNVGGFKVSTQYKSKCASCHGVNGEGGVGPKIIGQSYEKVSQDLVDFKSGAKKNYVMYGLLQNLDDEALDALSKEIAAFAQKAKALENN